MTNSRLNTNNASEKRNNAATTLLDSVKLETSKKIASAIEAISFEFSSVRTAILSYVANDTRLSLFKDNDVIKVLRVSKKDTGLYKKLLMLSAFSYKRIKGKEKDSFVIRKSYTVTQVLNCVDFFCQSNKVELTDTLIEAIKLEQELRAIEKVKKSLERAQNNVHTLQRTVNSLTDTKDADLLKDFQEQLTKAESALKNVTSTYEYVLVKTNRDLIK